MTNNHSLFSLDGKPLIMLRLSVEQVRALDRQAAAAGLSISEYIAALIDVMDMADDEPEEDPGQVGPR